MAFDSVFSGPPSGVAAPGTAQSPAFGIDVTNSELYFSAGSGWEPIIGSGDISGSGTTGFIPKFTAGTVVGNSAIDDGITATGKITSTEPLNVTSTSANTFAGNVNVTAAGLNTFTGPLKVPYTEANVVYSVAGTPLPAAATAGIGARAFVSDATTVTFSATYTGSSTGKVPVYSDGTNWLVG